MRFHSQCFPCWIGCLWDSTLMTTTPCTMPVLLIEWQNRIPARLHTHTHIHTHEHTYNAFVEWCAAWAPSHLETNINIHEGFQNALNNSSKLICNCASIHRVGVLCFVSVIDCTVSEWGVWSECDVACGTGQMTRTRKVLTAPENGGKHCPSLVQKRGCQGYKCHGQKDRRVLRGKFDGFSCWPIIDRWWFCVNGRFHTWNSTEELVRFSHQFRCNHSDGNTSSTVVSNRNGWEPSNPISSVIIWKTHFVERAFKVDQMSSI